MSTLKERLLLCRMKMTLVAATKFEIAPTIQFLEEQELQVSDQWEVLITGIGSLLTTWVLAHHLATSKPSLMIQAGIGGSFTNLLPPGSVVMVREEFMADLGVEEKGVFKDIFDMQFLSRNEYPFQEGGLKNPFIDKWSDDRVPAVTGVTVNEITTNQRRIGQLRGKYSAGVESMEGAAFHYAALEKHIPFLQLRAVSNFVGERDKHNWQLRQSIEALNNVLQTLIIEQSS
jgi:futalosine hydrolase